MDRDKVISGILKEREALRGRIRDVECQAGKMRETLHHIDATLRHLGYETAKLSSRKTKKPLASGLFYTGELPRMILRILRAHPNGLQLRSLCEQICAEKGWQIEEPNFYPALSEKVGRTLTKYRAKGAIDRHGRQGESVWRIQTTKELPK